MKYNIVLNGKTKEKDLTLFNASKSIERMKRGVLKNKFITIVLLKGKSADDNEEFVITAL